MKTQGMKILSVLLLALAFEAGSSLPALAETGQVTIKATGFKGDRGQALFAVVDSSEAYGDIGEKALAKNRQKIKEGKAETSFTLPYGWYAVSVVHDENHNLKLDTNFLGIPTEAFGFSNNPGGLGKPSFEAVKFELSSAHQEIEISVD